MATLPKVLIDCADYQIGEVLHFVSELKDCWQPRLRAEIFPLGGVENECASAALAAA